MQRQRYGEIKYYKNAFKNKFEFLMKKVAFNIGLNCLYLATDFNFKEIWNWQWDWVGVDLQGLFQP